MGMSASAYIAFGVDLGAQEEWDEIDDRQKLYDKDNGCELGPYLARRKGLQNPYIPHEVDDYRAWKKEHPEFAQAIEAWYDAKKQLEEEAPVTILQYGHYEYLRYALVLKGTIRSADWEPTKLNQALIVDLGACTRAERFCVEHELPFKTPTWLLMASYG